MQMDLAPFAKKKKKKKVKSWPHQNVKEWENVYQILGIGMRYTTDSNLYHVTSTTD